EDRKFHELVSVRNTADNMIHATRKTISELGDDKIEAGEKAAIEAAIKDLEGVMKSDDKDAIEAKTTALTELSGKLAEKLYAEKGGEAGGDDAGGNDAQGNAGNDDVVDAEFEEVKEKK
ncbi:MAG: Hsp70 family protein, partial [Gammaproteobacteria bacterium]|nr:Hsp70 family protein [Gammaproteobacteria bacterium]